MTTTTTTRAKKIEAKNEPLQILPPQVRLGRFSLPTIRLRSGLNREVDPPGNDFERRVEVSRDPMNLRSSSEANLRAAGGETTTVVNAHPNAQTIREEDRTERKRTSSKIALNH
jgi:hypothetical protein